MNCAVFTLEQGYKFFFKTLLQKTNKLGRREYDFIGFFLKKKKNWLLIIFLINYLEELRIRN